MIGIGGLESTYGQTDFYAQFSVGASMGQPHGLFYQARHEDRFATFAHGGLARLKSYIESKLKLDEQEEDDEEMDLEGASNLIYALGTDMGIHLDEAVKTQQYVNPDRAVTLIW